MQVSNSATECTASLEAEVKVYGSQHDPSFGLEATINGSKTKRNGEVVEVVGQVNKEAYLALYVWSPSSAGDQYQLIFQINLTQKTNLTENFKFLVRKNQKLIVFSLIFPKTKMARQ